MTAGSRALVSVVVVNWNAAAYLGGCLQSLADFGCGHIVDTIVVDNGSSDDSADVAEAMPGVRVVRLGQNLGFARACNIGARLARGELLLFLNPDAALLASTLSNVLRAATDSANAGVGIFGVQLVGRDGTVARSCADFPGPISMLENVVGLDRIFKTCGYVLRSWDHGDTRTVDHVIGAFFLVRRAVFESLRGFDERYFLYFEDLDFSLRAKRAGWDSMFVSCSRAFHIGGGVSSQVRARRLFYALRSRLLYARSHFGRLGAAAVMVATLTVEPVVRTVAALAGRSWLECTQTWAAYWLLTRWWLGHRLVRGADR